MDAETAFKHIVKITDHADLKRYFNTLSENRIKTGSVVKDVIIPFFDTKEDRYRKLLTTVLVFSHECDFDTTNERTFNDKLLVCPLISIEELVATFNEVMSDDEILNLISSIVNRKVFRVMYLPCFDVFEFGALIYFNDISNTSTNQLATSAAIALTQSTEFGQVCIDRMLQNHLFRPYD